jgi:colanic acid biosynthesis glycosyl transferase WcaI
MGIPNEKMFLIYPWVDLESIKLLPKINNFSKNYKIYNKFVILYAGNIGLSQGLNTILKVADSLKPNKDIIFVIVGDGAGKEALIDEKKTMNLNNILFLPFQNRKKLSEVLSSADISLVMLKPGISSGSIPSKTFTVMASGRAVIVSADKNSEICELIKKSESGICVQPATPNELKKAIIFLKNNNEYRMQIGNSGRIWVEKYHSLSSAANQFEKLFSLTFS